MSDKAQPVPAPKSSKFVKWWRILDPRSRRRPGVGTATEQLACHVEWAHLSAFDPIGWPMAVPIGASQAAVARHLGR